MPEVTQQLQQQQKKFSHILKEHRPKMYALHIFWHSFDEFKLVPPTK